MRLTLAAIALGLGALAACAALGWPGTPVDCTTLLCYCEARSPGPWRQPINTWSNVVPLLCAVAMARSHPNRFFAVAFPLALVAQGIGSMFFHASLVEWAGAVDAASMFMVTGVILALNLHRGGVLAERDLPAFLGLFAALGVALGVFTPAAVGPLVGLLFFCILATEAWLHRRRPGLPGAWFRVGLCVFMFGGTVWFGSAVEGMPLCAPGSLWQGHALWHATSALALYCFWRHLAECASITASDPSLELPPPLSS